MNKTTKPILISGIQPTGTPHLGNYIGVLANFIQLQNEHKYKCYFFIADLHSLTERIDPREKTKHIKNTAAIVRALGVGKRDDRQTTDEAINTFFLQSAVFAHSELGIILNNIAPFSELRRMTQFKDKSRDQLKNINVGLFDYPVLMAADILLYDADFVPVGDDQRQHLELTRSLARKFNDNFGKTFTEPEPKFSAMPRVMSLDNPRKKMSKSRPAGCLFLDDSDIVISGKIKSAVTDSKNKVGYDPKKRPGISNLVCIYSVLCNKPIKEIVDLYQGKGYANFKKDLTDVIVELLKQVREQKEKIVDNVEDELKKGSDDANLVAIKKLEQVKERLGLLSF